MIARIAVVLPAPLRPTSPTSLALADRERDPVQRDYITEAMVKIQGLQHHRRPGWRS